MEEFKSKPWSSSKTGSKPATTLSKLFTKNRAYTQFDSKVAVREEHLKKITDVASKIDYPGSGLKMATQESQTWQSNFTFEYQLNVQHPGTDANAHIIIRPAEQGSAPLQLIDLGVLIQSMLLRATEMGLNGTCHINTTATTTEAIISIGKGLAL